MTFPSLFRRFAIRSRNGLRRTIYRQRIRLGLVPKRFEIRDDAFERLRSVCIFLGPYRNLTTLTAALLSLHPKCQVLNHSGFRILEERQLNFFADPSMACFRRFLQYIVTESQRGSRGDEGGSITLSHAFGSGLLRDTYRARHGEQLENRDAECYVWKESLTVTNYLRSNNIDLTSLFDRNPHIKFLLPIRHPIDCAISNAKTGHGKRFNQVENQNPASILNAVIREVAWFREQATRYPERFFSFCQYEFDAEMLSQLARFLLIEADWRWVSDALKCYELKPSYDHSPELLATFRSSVEQQFAGDSEFKKRMLRFLD